ncbi:ac145 [Malacosoma neustria nucleopolyhedrovirus]|uniref:ac145 n=1 Tax=Malacosoma neustria nuclear polyhedrosis virus TaxID=38012 RepID=UPI000E35B48E|nr:ac145 [Malacosoma neustria nucleopolyhedrovirus]AUF81540.1 ac145 [Malacosoma neustria nucleopolyhedrovirus]
MWILLAILVLVKVAMFHQMQKLHLNVHIKQLCPNGYHGLVPDPYDCNAYYMCPESIQFFCPLNYQFDLDRQTCLPQNLHDGCLGRLYRNLLI